jgi:hypothetical protein
MLDAFRTLAVCLPPEIRAKFKQIQSLAAAYGVPPRPDRGTLSNSGFLVFIMATSKMTFSVHEPLAVQFLRRATSRDRSGFGTEAVAARLEERDIALIRACEIANEDLSAKVLDERRRAAIVVPVSSSTETVLEGCCLDGIMALQLLMPLPMVPDNLGCRARVFPTRKPATASDIGS